jgi:four helix bundle protein
MQDFRKLKVWQKAHRLTLAVYAATATFPIEEIYGLRSQIRRAACSIGLNIAEGCGRTGRPELSRFLRIAMGSASELEYQLLLARDLRMIEDGLYECLSNGVSEVKRMTAGLIRRLRTEN